MSKLIAALALLLLTTISAVNANNEHHDQVERLLDSAVLCQRAARLEEANAFYTQVLSIDGKNYRALNNRGGNYFALGQYKKALNDANGCVALRPDLVSYLHRSNVLAALEQYDKALADIDRCIRPDGRPEQIQWVFLRRTVMRMLAGHYQDARAAAYTHLNTVPRSVLSFEMCSLANALCGMESDSINFLTRFSNSKFHSNSVLNTSRIQSRHNISWDGDLSEGALTDNERKQLIDHLESSHASLTPAQYRFAIALIYFYQRDYDRAISAADHCDSANMRLYSDLLTFNCHFMKRAFPQALATLNRLESKFPDSQDVLDAIDLYHYAADTRQASIAEIKAMLAKNPKNTAALIELAKIFHDLSQQEECLKYCNLALQFNPRDADLLLMKANIMNSQRNYADGLKTLSDLIVKDRENGAAYLARAAIYTEKGLWPDAINDLSQAILLKYDLSRSYKARASCYAALKQYDLERKDFSTVKLMDPPDNALQLINH